MSATGKTRFAGVLLKNNHTYPQSHLLPPGRRIVTPPVAALPPPDPAFRGGGRVPVSPAVRGVSNQEEEPLIRRVVGGGDNELELNVEHHLASFVQVLQGRRRARVLTVRVQGQHPPLPLDPSAVHVVPRLPEGARQVVLPTDDFAWRDHDAVSSINNQGSCSSRPGNGQHGRALRAADGRLRP